MDRRYHGQDTSSAMHSTVPDGVVIADAKDAGDPFGLSQNYGETFPRIKSNSIDRSFGDGRAKALTEGCRARVLCPLPFWVRIN